MSPIQTFVHIGSRKFPEFFAFMALGARRGIIGTKRSLRHVESQSQPSVEEDGFNVEETVFPCRRCSRRTKRRRRRRRRKRRREPTRKTSKCHAAASHEEQHGNINRCNVSVIPHRTCKAQGKEANERQPFSFCLCGEWWWLRDLIFFRYSNTKPPSTRVSLSLTHTHSLSLHPLR